MAEASQVAIVHGPPVPSLRRWGLSADGDLVYRALLLASAAAQCSQLSRDLGLSLPRTRSALDELSAAGAVHEVAAVRSGATKRDRAWRAAAPDRVLALLRRQRTPGPDPWDQIRRHIAVVTGLRLPETDHDQFRLRRLPSRPLARRRIAELVAGERHEHLAINTERAFSADTVAAALPLDRDRRRRGLRTRVVGLPPVDGDAGCPAAEELSGLSSEYRERATVPLKLMVFDRAVAILPADPADFDRGIVEVADQTAVATLVQLFYRQWEGAHDPRATGVPRILLSLREKAVVAVLAAGGTDQQAAQRLSLSRRTVVTTVSGLMDRLGVENRFQLGLVLGARADIPQQLTRVDPAVPAPRKAPHA